MLVILSQKVDSASGYADEVFTTYHYPSRYRNQLHVGDVFVYYQGNRYDRTQRYYFGTGTVEEIMSSDADNFYAKLGSCKRFERKIPIYLPDGGYIEQLGYQEVRRSINPPWQSSIRPLSEQAYNYIMSHSGIHENIPAVHSVDDLKEQLKKSIRSFYVENDESSILEITKTAQAISEILNFTKDDIYGNTLETKRQSCALSSGTVEDLKAYCLNMKMSYSYKPILILALLSTSEKNWEIHISEAAEYILAFYRSRRDRGLQVERKKCIYQYPGVTIDQIVSNLIANPVKALTESGYFEYNSENGVFSLINNIKKMMTTKSAWDLFDICNQKLTKYYER